MKMMFRVGRVGYHGRVRTIVRGWVQQIGTTNAHDVRPGKLSEERKRKRTERKKEKERARGRQGRGRRRETELNC